MILYYSSAKTVTGALESSQELLFHKLLLAANETLTVRRYLASLLASHELRDH